MIPSNANYTLQVINRKEKYIVYFVPNIYPCSTGGLEIFYSHLIKHVADNAKVLLITCCKNYVQGNYKVVVIPRNIMSVPWTTTVVTFLFTAFTLIKFKNSIQIIHFPYTSNAGKWGYLMPVFRHLFGIKYLLHFHGGGMGEWKNLSGNRALIKSADYLLSVSTIMQKEYEKRSGKPVHLVYPVYPFNKTSISKSTLRKKFDFVSDDRIILYVGSLKTVKAPQILIDAFINTRKEYSQNKNLRLLIIGIGPMQKSLEKQVNLAGLKNDIRIMGFVPNDEISAFYKISDFYVITSHFEGTPKSLLEAMFNKLPIIGTNVSGINNILTHEKNGLLFEKDNPKQLMTCLKRLIEDPILANSLGQSAYKTYLDSYTFDSTLSDLLNIYSTFI